MSLLSISCNFPNHSKFMPLAIFPADTTMLLRWSIFIIVACFNNDDNEEDDYDYSDCEHKS